MSFKVLVCDDQALIREVLGDFLTRKGYDVSKVRGGKECLEFIRKEHFDVVFLDIQMPDMDGMTVMGKIEKLNKGVQIVLMSGLEKSTLEIADLKSKHDAAFISKPFSLEHVVKVITASKKPSVNKVLVVDDQDMIREMLKDFLGKEGYEIIEARDGKECLTQTRNQQFDAIFMDVRMPVMDGIDALKALRAQGVNSPVFLMSGYGDIGSVEDAKFCGAQDFLPKPFKLEAARKLLSNASS